jgi:hypothetical protein
MNFGFVGDLTDIVDDIGSTIGQEYYDSYHPFDTAAMAPFIGAPFGYHAFREGRSGVIPTITGLVISVGTTEALFLMAGRSAGIGSLEWTFGRGLSALGLRYGGRSYTVGAILGPRAGAAAAVGWGLPAWFNAVLMYEYGMWFGDYVAARTPGSLQWHQRHGTKFG